MKPQAFVLTLVLWTAAVLVPPLPLDERAPQATLAGTVEILGDVVAPALPAVEWEAEGGTSG